MMKRILRTLVKQALPPSLRQNIKRYARRAEASRISGELSAQAFRDVLTGGLGLKRDDTVLVHASFGRLKPGFTPATAIEIIQQIIGANGNVLMPVYPGNGDEWLAADKVFDPLTSPISTGVLGAQFARMPEVRVSIHPIKAVAAWGLNRAFLTEGHESSTTPFDAHSPYAKLLTMRNAKAIGLGTSRLSFIHCGEDAVPEYVEKVYSAVALPGRCLAPSGDIVTVQTRVHRSEVMRDTPGADFLESRNSSASRKLTVDGRSYYIADVAGVYEHMKEYAQGYATAAG
jgi:aminoglycoside N3'-acetyltransferase